MCFCILGCTSNVGRIKGVYNSRKDILFLFLNKSIFRDRDGHTIFVYTYNTNNQRNQYVFDRRDGELFLFRDSISFAPDSILMIENNRENKNYVPQLKELVKSLLSKMDSLHITDVSSDFIKKGVSLKIYLKGEGVIVYAPNMEDVKGVEWRKYIESMKKLDDFWYYSVEE